MVATEPQKVQKIRIAKHHVGRQTVFVAERGNILFDQVRRFLADRRPLEQQVSDLVAQSANAPAFDSTHFRVKVAFQAIVNGKNLDEMTPAQLCRQRRHNFRILKILGKLDHSKEISPSESSSELLRQLCRQRRHNFLPVRGTVIFQHVHSNSPPDMPVHANQRRIDSPRRLLPSLFNQMANITQQRRVADLRYLARGEVGYWFLFSFGHQDAPAE